MAGYDDLDGKKAEAKARGKLLGLGLSTYIEVCGVAPSKWIGAVGEGWGAAMWESSNIRVHLTGKVVVTMGTQPQGQGHETTYAQVVAQELGVPMEDIVVQHSDTLGTPFGYGSYGSRTSSVGMTAAIKAAGKIREKARKYAAHMLEASPEDIEVDGANYRVKGSPDKVKTIQEIAFALDLAFDAPEGMEPYLDETAYYDTPNCTWPFGTHIAIVEIDEETGHVELVRYIAVDDVGKKINPMIVDGQLHGGIAQGVGQALWEGAVYSDDGQLLTGSMLDYALPRAAWFPTFELDETVTPVAGQPDRRQGRRRGRRHRQHGGGRERGHRRAGSARHPAPRHAVLEPDRLASHPVREGRPGMIPAAFSYERPDDPRRGPRRARGVGRLGQGHRRRDEPAAADEAAAGPVPTRSSTSVGSASSGAPGPTADGGYEMGALTTYAEAPRRDVARVRAKDCLDDIGDVQVRNRGTVGGAIAHCDPASDAPGARRSRSTTRPSSARPAASGSWPLDGFFQGAVPDRDGVGRDPRHAPPRPAAGRGRPARTAKLAQPASGYSIVGVAAVVARGSDGAISHARVALTGVGEHPYRAKAVEAALLGSDGSADDDRGRRRARDRRGRRSTATSTPTGPTGRRWLPCTPAARSRPRSAGLPDGPGQTACASNRSPLVGARPIAWQGAVLARDLTVAGQRWSKGRRLSVDDLLALGGAEPGPPVTVLVAEAGELHEDDAAVRLGEGRRRGRAGGPRAEPEPHRPGRGGPRASSTSGSPSSSASTASTRSRSSRSSTARSSTVATSSRASRWRPMSSRRRSWTRASGSPTSGRTRSCGSRRSSRRASGSSSRNRSARTARERFEAQRPREGGGPWLDDRRRSSTSRTTRTPSRMSWRGSRAVPIRWTSC